jgi:hypothetical protein
MMELALRLRPKNHDNYALPFKAKKNLSPLGCTINSDHKYMFSWLNDFTDWPWTHWQE